MSSLDDSIQAMSATENADLQDDLRLDEHGRALVTILVAGVKGRRWRRRAMKIGVEADCSSGRSWKRKSSRIRGSARAGKSLVQREYEDFIRR